MGMYKTYEAIFEHISITPRSDLKKALLDCIQYGKLNDPYYGKPVGIIIRHMYYDGVATSRSVMNKAEYKTLQEIYSDDTA